MGGKAAGLFRLKCIERLLVDGFKRHFLGVSVPSFFVVPDDYDLNSRKTIDALITSAASLGVKSYAVRSSSPLEDGSLHSWDGIFNTELNVPLGGLIDSIKRVKTSAKTDAVEQYAKDFGLCTDGRMPVIIQPFIELGRLGEKGVIYSTTPATVTATKIRTWDMFGEEKICILKKSAVVKSYILFEEGGIESDDAVEYSALADTIEKEFGHPVRIEFIRSNLGRSDTVCLYLLQARAIIGLDRTATIDDINLEGLEFIGGSGKVNGIGDFTLPVVNVADIKNCENISNEDIISLDQRYSNGYVLVCSYLEFWGSNIECITPNKKAVITCFPTMGGEKHNWDIARQKGLLYMSLDNLGSRLYRNTAELRTGDMVRFRSDGIKGMLYKLINPDTR